MIVSMIAAMSENRAIGKENDLPWHIPADLKHFKSKTAGHTVIMGRKTFDSIKKPLPKRRNIIITRNQDYLVNGAEVCHSVEEALKLAKDEKEVFICGGAQIYRDAMDLADRIYLTEVHLQVDGDTFFPEIDFTKFKEVSRDKTPECDFVVYERMI